MFSSLFYITLFVILTSAQGSLVHELKAHESGTHQVFTHRNVNESQLDDYVLTESDIIARKPSPDNKEIYSEFLHLKNQQNHQINLLNVSDDVAYVIFQVHSQYHRVELYQESLLLQNTSVQGTNIAIYSETFKEPFFIVNNYAELSFNVYVSVHAYGQNDPIPGGCSMEQSVPIAPFMQIDYFDYYVQVAAPPPKNPLDPNCLIPTGASISFYVLYLPGLARDAESYLKSIKQMLTWEGIEEKGTLVPETLWRVRRKVSRYQGTSRVFVAVARTNKGYSIYAPIFEHGCNYDDCYIGGFFFVYMYLMTFLAGFLLCYLGRRYFYMSFFLITFYIGFTIMYSFIVGLHYQDETVVYAVSICYGFLMSLYWVWTWYVGRTPSFSLLICITSVGCLVGAFVYYGIGDNVPYLRVNQNFWCVYGVVILLTNMLLFGIPDICMLCTPWLGSYMMVFAISHFVGANTKFIAINVVRRITMSEFNEVLIMKPMQYLDIVMMGLMTSLALSGLVVQLLWHHYRPQVPAVTITWFTCTSMFPFREVPPNSVERHGGTAPCNEQTPLLS